MWNAVVINKHFNPGPAGPWYALLLQTVQIQISCFLNLQMYASLHYLPFSMWICSE